ncbi:MAG: putative DNA binding domain-containing protein [Prolixibacteraceae bacterium]|nr:putative DNA binding domain-containing protein [Prolixibacteraceae bacterium]HNZ65424.1 ATP-binding protein [Smithella sp.]
MAKSTSVEEFSKWLTQDEGENLEFKTATNQFSRDKDLPDYCAALANEGGGKLILGVNNERAVVGTKAFAGKHNRLSNELLNKLGIRVDVEELYHAQTRVLIFHIPSRPIGSLVKSSGKYKYPMRAGESLVEMDLGTIKQVLNETQSDFTAEIVPGLTLDDLSIPAIEILNKKWAKEAQRTDYLSFDAEKTLRNLGLRTDTGITYTALLLVGKAEAIRKHLPDAEIIFEWRHDPKQTHYDFRKNWRAAFVEIDDDIWNTINARNIRIPFQEGFFQREVWGFDEKSIREAVHNAVMHRDYTCKNRSVFIKASPEEFNIESPGGFPPGITLENILYERVWRNRTLAEAFEKIGFAERSGQGLDDIFERAIKDGKGLPDLSKSTKDIVRLSIPAQVKDKDFILYLERIINERQILLSFEEIYELEKIREFQKIEKPEFKDKFIKLGVIESIGKGRGTKYILSNRYYETIGQSGKHTRIKGLNRDQFKELILNHIREGKPSRRTDFMTGFSEYKPKDISNILQELKREDKIIFIGNRTWVIKE